jgi:hypothetical protein
MNPDDAAQDAELHFKAIGCEIACPICLSYFDDPYSTPCHHVFCHSCIQKAISVKQQCPVCKFPVWRRSLNQNPILAHIVEHYSKLERLLEDSKTSSSRFPIGILCGVPPCPPHPAKMLEPDAAQEKDRSVESVRTSTGADAFAANPEVTEREVNRVDVDVIRTYLHDFLECVSFSDDCLTNRKKSTRPSSSGGREGGRRRTRGRSSPSSVPAEPPIQSRSKMRKTGKESRKDMDIDVETEKGVGEKKGTEVSERSRRTSSRVTSRLNAGAGGREDTKVAEIEDSLEGEGGAGARDDAMDMEKESIGEKGGKETTSTKKDKSSKSLKEDGKKIGKRTRKMRRKKESKETHDADDHEEEREMIICRKMINVRDRRQLDRLVHNADFKGKARSVEDILDDATHLVVKVNAEGRCKRTSSYIVALWRNVHIVSDLWVRMSSETGCWMDLEPFIVRGDDHGVDGVCLRESYVLQSFFEGKPKIGFFGSIHAWPRGHLRAAVECGGGRVIDPVTFPLKQSKPTSRDPLIVVYDGDHQSIRKHERNMHVTFVPVQWLIEVLSTFVWIEPSGFSIGK